MQAREPHPYTLDQLVKDTRKVIEDAKGKCADLLGKDALAAFDRISKNIIYDKTGKIVDSDHAVTSGEDIYLNPWSYVFNEESRKPLPESKNSPKSIKAQNESRRDNQKLLEKYGISSYQYAIAAVIHEFLHATGTFPADSRTTISADGTIRRETGQSKENQLEVIKKCFSTEK